MQRLIGGAMKADTHPDYKITNVVCSCGNTFVTRSACRTDTLRLEVCSECHPFFTGKHKIVDTAGRVEQFMRRYGSYKKGSEANKADETKAE